MLLLGLTRKFPHLEEALIIYVSIHTILVFVICSRGIEWFNLGVLDGEYLANVDPSPPLGQMKEIIQYCQSSFKVTMV